jgi:CIC family chloride channel protein
MVMLVKDLVKLGAALLFGNVVGAATVAFFAIILYAWSIWKIPLLTDFVSWNEARYSPTLGAFMLVGALLAGWIYRHLEGPRTHGPADTIVAIKNDTDIDVRSGLWSSLLTLTSVGSGSSAGLFGPIVHYGACIGSLLQRVLPVLNRSVLLAAGGAAALAALFSAPIAACIFAHEMLLRRFRSSETAPMVMAALGGYFASAMYFGSDRKLLKIVGHPLEIGLEPLLFTCMLGLLCGLLSTAYIYLLTRGPKWANSTGIPIWLRPMVPAALLFSVSPFLPQLIGPGLGSVNMALAGEFGLWLLLVLMILKIVAAALCRSFGFHGGIFLPAVFFGAMLGGIFDALLGGGHHMYALLGAAACAGSAIGAPIAAVVFLFEMSGDYRFIVLAMVSVAISCQVSRTLIGRSVWDRALFLRGIDTDDQPKAVNEGGRP